MISPAKVKAREERAATIYKLWADKGETFAAIGKKYGISKQRVGQIIHRYVIFSRPQ